MARKSFLLLLRAQIPCKRRKAMPFWFRHNCGVLCGSHCSLCPRLLWVHRWGLVYGQTWSCLNPCIAHGHVGSYSPLGCPGCSSVWIGIGDQKQCDRGWSHNVEWRYYTWRRARPNPKRCATTQPVVLSTLLVLFRTPLSQPAQLWKCPPLRSQHWAVCLIPSQRTRVVELHDCQYQQ